MTKINIFLDDQNGGLYQWDTGQRLWLYGVEAGVRVDYVMGTQVLSVDTYADGGHIYADIPNILLQYSGGFRVLVYVTGEGYGETIKEARFPVHPREKPADCIYSETDVRNIEQAVADYLTEHPVEETDPTVPDWAKQPKKPTYTAQEVGAAGRLMSIDNATSESIFEAVADMYSNGRPYITTRTNASEGDGVTDALVLYYPNQYFVGSEYRTYTGLAVSGNDGAVYEYRSKIDFGEYSLTLTKRTDIALGMTGAEVGQIAKITAVDDDGKPTAWEPGGVVTEDMFKIDIVGKYDLTSMEFPAFITLDLTKYNEMIVFLSSVTVADGQIDVSLWPGWDYYKYYIFTSSIGINKETVPYGSYAMYQFQKFTQKGYDFDGTEKGNAYLFVSSVSSTSGNYLQTWRTPCTPYIIPQWDNEYPLRLKLQLGDDATVQGGSVTVLGRRLS